MRSGAWSTACGHQRWTSSGWSGPWDSRRPHFGAETARRCLWTSIALPAAVEVAAYRVVVEALTNVARHSRGSMASVFLGVEIARLVLVVTDNGSSDGEWRPGVGLGSMRERAAEVGGELSCGPTPYGGRVSAVLPLL